MNNGFSTGYFALERGTRQGDPLSTYLFISAIEVLLIRVRDSELVRGIPVIDKEIKLDADADDGRFFLKALQSLYTILDFMEEFGMFTSLKLNLQRSEACWIGASRFNTNTSTNCIWVNLLIDKIRILGTYINYNKQLADQYNFVNDTTDTKNILSIWRLRALSLAGRIQVFKALALSKAMFICTMKPYSKKFLDDLNEIQKDFIWRGRKPKIKHTSLQRRLYERYRYKSKAGIFANTVGKKINKQQFSQLENHPYRFTKRCGRSIFVSFQSGSFICL